MIALGEEIVTDMGDLDFLRWNTQVGRHIAAYVRDLSDEGDDRWSANLVMCSSELVDWAAAEYVLVEKSGRPALPTEVLNADGCRVFGRMTKLGWSGAALVLAGEPDTACMVLGALSVATGNDLCIFVTAATTDRDTWTTTVTSFRHE